MRFYCPVCQFSLETQTFCRILNFCRGMVLVSFVKLGARRHDVLMMMTTIPSPQQCAQTPNAQKTKKDPNAYRLLCSIAHRRRRLTFAQKGGKKRPLERGVQTKKLSNWIEFHVPRLYLVHRLRRTRRLITSRGVICIRVHLLHHSRLRAGACGGRATTTFVAHLLF